MMRNVLLAGVAVLALAGPAYAQIPVVESGLEDQGWQALASWSTELKNWTTQLQSMQSQLQTMLGVYNTLTHATDMGSVVGALGALGIQNPLPVNPWAVQQLVSGNNTGFAGIGAAISGLVNQSWTQNHVYTPTTGYFGDQQMIDKANGLAGTQGLTQQLYQSISDRLPLLTQLHDEIIASPDIKNTADLQARFAVESSYVQGQIAQFNAISQMATTQQAVWQQQADEQDSKNLHAFVEQAAAHGY